MPERRLNKNTNTDVTKMTGYEVFQNTIIGFEYNLKNLYTTTAALNTQNTIAMLLKNTKHPYS